MMLTALSKFSFSLDRTYAKDPPCAIGISITAPLLVGVLAVARVNLEHIAVRNLPIGEVDVLVRTGSLEGPIRHRDPLLVLRLRDTTKFGALCRLR
jgi:hypothetical protein